MTYSVLDADGIKRYFTALGAGTADDPYVSMPTPYERGLVDLGVVFVHSDKHTIANNGSFSYLIKTPASPAHTELLGLEVATTSAIVYVDVYENTVVTANGAMEDLYNMNRQSTTGAATQIYYNPTYNAGAEGIYLFAYVVNGEKSIGGYSSQRDRVILKPSYNYLVKVNNSSGASATIAMKLIIGED